MDLAHKIRTRQGDKEYERNHRPVLSSSVVEAFGPGSKYQIDATVGDVYLVSKYNNEWIIGRPVIYIVTDVYSRMIVGLYIGLEGPSWIGMAMALANATGDKVKFCADYGVNIARNEWPCNHLPSKLLGDNGELRRSPVHMFIDSLGVHVENAPVYRPDWKGIVENKFRMINLKVMPFIPGVVLPRVIGRSKDYRLDATLTIDDFYKVMILNILRYNSTTLSNYPMEDQAIADRVRSKPLELWNWGCSTKGNLKEAPEDIIKLSLMQTKVVKIDGGGIKFQRGLYYTCQLAIKERWFTDSAATGTSREITVAYDPRNMDHIYWKRADGRGYEVCNIIPEKSRGFVNKSLYDISYAQAYDAYNKQEDRANDTQREVDYMMQRDAAVKKAAERQKKNTSSAVEKSKGKRTKNIQQNRKVEKELNREKEAFVLGGEERSQKTLAKVVPINNQVNQSTWEDEDLDLLRRIREEVTHD